MSGRDKAIVYGEGAFKSANGVIARCLARRSQRYDLVAIIDSICAGYEAGELIPGAQPALPIVSTLDDAVELAWSVGQPVSHFILGLTTANGGLAARDRQVVIEALSEGLQVVAGLSAALAEDDDLASVAWINSATITDVCRPSASRSLHTFTGEIEHVGALRLAVLGTDPAVDQSSLAWSLVDELSSAGLRSELIGTGSTAWFQGVRYGVILDALSRTALAGELEQTIVEAWREVEPDLLVIEGQGSVLDPVQPRGFELLAAGRPHAVVLHHAPAKEQYVSFASTSALRRQIDVIELVSNKPVIAVTIEADGLDDLEIDRVCDAIREETGLPAVDPVRHGLGAIIATLKPWLRRSTGPAPSEVFQL